MERQTNRNQDPERSETLKRLIQQSNSREDREREGSDSTSEDWFDEDEEDEDEHGNGQVPYTNGIHQSGGGHGSQAPYTNGINTWDFANAQNGHMHGHGH